MRQLGVAIDVLTLERPKTSMGSAARYWRFVRIDAAGRRKVETLAPAQDFFQQQFADSIPKFKLFDEDIQRQLVLLSRNGERSGKELQNGSSDLRAQIEDANNIELAEVCLRCFVSNAIEQVCTQLEGQFGTKHGFSRYDLLPLVLDEDNPLRKSRRRESTNYRSVISTILKSFDPDRGSLTTWTVRLVRRNRDLNAYLLECGVYLISDWAILNDTTVRRVRRILSEFHTLTDSEIQEAAILLEAYHFVYRGDRLLKRKAGTVGRCPQPSLEQLQRMAVYLKDRDKERQLRLGEQEREPIEPNRLLARLQRLADWLRQYRIFVRGGPAQAESIEQEGKLGHNLPGVNNEEINPDREDRNEFIDYYREQFSTCMDLAIADTIERWVSTMRRKKSSKHQQFLQALALFHERGMSMGEIAPLVGLKAQYQVSRLLKLKELRADIRQSLLVELRDRVKQKAERYRSGLKDLHEIDRQIEAALSEQVDDVLQEAAAEASVAQKGDSTRSLYTRRLCQYLQSRSQES